MKIRTLILSDLHLGSNACNAELINDVLNYFDAELIILNGDIIDFWKLSFSKSWKKIHNKVLSLLIKKSRKGSKVVYIIGNHDEILREYIPLNLGENILLTNQYVHETDKNKVLFIHGDGFDFVIRSNKWLAKIGTIAYENLVILNHYYNVVRRFLGMRYWSLSKYLKAEVKKKTVILKKFDEVAVSYARKEGFDAICVGHIHIPEMKYIDDVLYMNTGDMCETGSFIIEHKNGKFEMVTDFHSFKS